MFDSPVASGVNVVHVNTAELFEVLTAASSQDASRLAGASKRLKEMLDMFGTYDALYEIASQRSVSLAVRQLAIIQFKNSAGHWRSRRWALEFSTPGVHNLVRADFCPTNTEPEYDNAPWSSWMSKMIRSGLFKCS